MKRLLILFAILFSLNTATGQKYVVFSMLGKVNKSTNKGPKPLELRETVMPNTVIIMPYDAEIVLFDQKNKKKYIITTPGQASVGQFIKDARNMTVNLSDVIFEAMIKRITSNRETIIQTLDDHITITRDSLIDSISVSKLKHSPIH